MKIDVLAVGAHPDDIEISAGATVASLTRQGKSVGIVDLTQGELGTRGTKSIRIRESQTAGKILGVSFRQNLALADGGIQITKKNILSLIKIIRAVSPEVMIFPHRLERHPDHEHAHQLCREAWFYAGLEKIKTVLDGKRQDPFRAKRCFYFMQKFEFTPTVIVDVSKHYEIKMDALKAFKSQFYDPESKERETILSSRHFLQMIRSRDMHHGGLINSMYGEPFFCDEPTGIDSFFSMVLR